MWVFAFVWGKKILTVARVVQELREILKTSLCSPGVHPPAGKTAFCVLTLGGPSKLVVAVMRSYL